MFDGLARASTVFYTHSVALYEAESKKTAMGDRYTAPGASLGGLACNVQPTSCEAIQKQYGVTVDEGWRMSSLSDERVKPGVYAFWNGGTYRVKAALHAPSHTSAVIVREEVAGG